MTSTEERMKKTKVFLKVNYSFKALKVSTKILKSILNFKGSQWRSNGEEII